MPEFWMENLRVTKAADFLLVQFGQRRLSIQKTPYCFNAGRKMKNKNKLLAVFIALNLFRAEFAHATASTLIWAPSTDTQDYGTGHITADVYVPVEKNRDG